ncbi:reverse transcriptase domain-containing protein [Tanacetum coccineum]
MLKFPVDRGIVSIRSSILILVEYATVITSSKDIPKEAGVHHENFKVALHLNFPDQEVAIRGMLSAKGRTKLCSLLKENLDIFAWQPSDMTGKKKGQALERAKAIQTEVQKLVEAGIMREVYYHEWLSNLVMEKKHDGSWQMCVDFTDLNKASPQDCYPLPEIDWKVESLCGYPFKCFLDAYKGYHQIQMKELDEENTAFHTTHGVYCYTKMPFGLKNVGATYQQLVDKAFDSQVGQNIEVYIDDLVIKSHTKAEMLRDINETFRTLRKINMKLNPKKYVGLLRKPRITGPRTKLYPNGKASSITGFCRQAVAGGYSKRILLRVDGSGAGLILTSPEGTEFTYALRFQFTASNNEAEYEALIAGLRIMAQMGVHNVHGASCTQRKVSMVPFVFSIPFVLIVIVVIVRVVIVVAIIGVVVIVGGVSSILKLSFVIVGFLRKIMFYYLLHQPLGYGNGFLQSLSQVVNFVFYFLDFSSRAILIGQEPFQFGLGDPVGLFYPNRLGICIPPRQGVIG